MKYVVDTHALIWFLSGSTKLGKAAEAALTDPESELVLPATALAEVCWIVERRAVGLSVAEALAAIDADSRIEVAPLSRAVIEKSMTLSAIGEMHDRQIAATVALMIEAGESVALLTVDVNITASGAIPIVWD